MNKILNSAYEEIKVGQTVDRLDGYKRGGKVLVINTEDHQRHPVLVRWPTMNDEWCSPELLVPRSEEPIPYAGPGEEYLVNTDELPEKSKPWHKEDAENIIKDHTKMDFSSADEPPVLNSSVSEISYAPAPAEPEKTVTTEHVRKNYALMVFGPLYSDFGYAEFDRWLAQHDKDLLEGRVPVARNTLSYAATALGASADNGDRYCAQQIREALKGMEED